MAPITSSVGVSHSNHSAFGARIAPLENAHDGERTHVPLKRELNALNVHTIDTTRNANAQRNRIFDFVRTSDLIGALGLIVLALLAAICLTLLFPLPEGASTLLS